MRISVGRGGLLEPQTDGIAERLAKQKPEREPQRLAKCVAIRFDVSAVGKPECKPELKSVTKAEREPK